MSRVLGMLGGMGWPSTLDAYRKLNTGVAAVRGGLATPELLLWSADFAAVEVLQATGGWDAAGELLAARAADLERAGAGALVLLTNTMHRVAPAIEAAVDVPLLHVGDATAAACHAAGAQRVGLLGTRFTMEEPGVRDRLTAHGLAVAVPAPDVREAVNELIYAELVHGTVTARAREVLADAAADLVAAGAQAVVAGCTEIELALRPDDVDVMLVPTTDVLVDAAKVWLLGGDPPAPPAG
jgi:aspartate racemase